MSERTRSILRRGVPGDVWTWPANLRNCFNGQKSRASSAQKWLCPEQISRAHRARPARLTTGFKGGIRAYSHTARCLCPLFLRALFFLLAPTPKPGSTLLFKIVATCRRLRTTIKAELKNGAHSAEQAAVRCEKHLLFRAAATSHLPHTSLTPPFL